MNEGGDEEKIEGVEYSCSRSSDWRGEVEEVSTYNGEQLQYEKNYS
jgi:hypothetical protein